MAIANPTVLASRFDVANAASLLIPASGTVSFVAGRLYLLFYGCHRSGAAPDLSTGMSITGQTGSWTFIGQTATFSAGLRRAGAWWFIPATTHSAAITVDPTGGTNSNNEGFIIEIASGFNSSNPIANFAVNTATAALSIAVNLSPAPGAGNLSVTFVFTDTSSTSVNAATGHTEIGEVLGGTSSDAGAVHVNYANPAVQNGGASVASTTRGWAGIHVEVAATAVAVTGTCRIEGRSRTTSVGKALKTGLTRIEGLGEERPAAGTRIAVGSARVEGSGATQAAAGTKYVTGSARITGVAEITSGITLPPVFGFCRIEGRSAVTPAAGIRYASGAARVEAGSSQGAIGTRYAAGTARFDGRGTVAASGLRYATGSARVGGIGLLGAVGVPYIGGSARIEGRSYARISISGATISGICRIEVRSDPGGVGRAVAVGITRIFGKADVRGADGLRYVAGTARISGRADLRVPAVIKTLSGVVRLEGRATPRISVINPTVQEDPNMFELLVPLVMGPDYAGNPNALRARFLNRDMTVRLDLPGVNPVTGWLQNTAGPPVVTYFYERGNLGSHFLSYASFPSDEVVGVEIDNGSGTVPTLFSINPAEMPTRARGQRTVIRTVKSSAVGNPEILNALLTLKGPTGIIIDRNYNDPATAQIRWALDDSAAGQNYTVTVSAPGFSPVVDVPFTVVGNSLSGDILLNPIAQTPAADVALCSVDDTLIDGFGLPVEGMTISALPDPLPQWVDTALIGGEKREDVTDAAGAFNLQLIRGKSYLIDVPLWGVSETLPVPDLPNTTLRAMLESMGIVSGEIPPTNP